MNRNLRQTDMEQQMEQIAGPNWKPKFLVGGALLGLIVGVAAAYMWIQRSEDDTPPEISAGDGVKIGVLVFGLLRSIAAL